MIQLTGVFRVGLLSVCLAFGLATLGGADASAQTGRPRPAVARIVVPERGGTAYGSGALVDARGDYGLVITNWHVVCEATGPIDVLFPSGFRSEARPLKLDEAWDLAALVIWRPPVEPLPLALHAPRPGDALTICGYGSGAYREATGRCTDYYAPEIGLPHELVELDVEARQGDSGGPILNTSGQVAGVLFGAGQGTTLGSFGGRVGQFLVSLSPDIGTPRRASPPVTAPAQPKPTPLIASLGAPQPVAGAPASRPHMNQEKIQAEEDRWAYESPPRAETSPVTPPSPAIALGPPPNDPDPTPLVAAMNTSSHAPELSAPAWFDQAKSIFAIVGLVFVLMQLIRVVT